jgi:phosphate transport system permease protein
VSTAPLRLATLRPRSRLSRARRVRNSLAAALIALGTALVLLPLVLILAQLIIQGLSSLNLAFFTQLPRPVGETGGGMGQAIVGSFILVAIALVLGTTIGIGTGVYLAEYAESRLSRVVRVMSDVLAGVPAIVVGLVVYALLVRPMRNYSAIAGGVDLGLIMIPIIVRATEGVLRLVPISVREAGLALGLPRWKVTVAITLPAALPGIITGVMLAVARVAGEAAPLLFTALGTTFWPQGLVGPISALPLQVYQYAISAYPEENRLAWAGALVLVVLVFVASLVARLATRRRY